MIAPETIASEAAASHHLARFRAPFHEPGPEGTIGIVPLANYLQQAAGEHAEWPGPKPAGPNTKERWRFPGSSAGNSERLAALPVTIVGTPN
jgi:hypothetical protein